MEEKTMEITSPAFKSGGMIPQRYTCDGDDVSPPLEWRDAPKNTQAFALICDDPDAPMGTWVHWVVYDLPAHVTKLAEGLPADRQLENGGKHGTTSARSLGYHGPCPPSGVHRYFFKLYALDGPTDLPPGATKERLLAAMKGHILAEAELMGRYKRK
ncbi:MAG: YbhB/YbcL family Raf kinase inhibitor-like protein [Syntrophobacterales bacterium]|nr:YbhB/YbcL family Raf kinase inhibitor-like protein [Syntrophobacterales bacterium]